MTLQAQYLSIRRLEQIANESASEIDDSDLDDKFLHKIDDDSSDLDGSGGVSNLQEESYICFINSVLLSGP